MTETAQSQATTAELDLTGAALGPYRLQKRLGHGGMGVVYRALREPDATAVAVKILLPEHVADPISLARFVTEARLAKLVRHPNTVELLDVDQHSGRHYLVMELVEGGTLQEALELRGPLDWRAAVAVLREACRGLIAVHEAGLVHRDIKPANLMRTADGRVKLADFGLAKDVTGLAEAESLTSTGNIVGTPAYLSPERVRGDPADARSDLYAMGVTLYALVVGRPPFSDDRGTVQLLMARMLNPIPSVKLERPDLPEAVNTLIARSAANEPSHRYPSAEALCRDLDAVLTTGATLPTEEVMKAAPPSPGSADPPRGSRSAASHTELIEVGTFGLRRREWLWLVAGLVGLVLLLGGAMSLGTWLGRADSGSRTHHQESR